MISKTLWCSIKTIFKNPINKKHIDKVKNKFVELKTNEKIKFIKVLAESNENDQINEKKTKKDITLKIFKNKTLFFVKNVIKLKLKLII